MARQASEIQDSSFYEQSQRALKVGYYVPVCISLGITAASLALAPAEGWERIHALAEEKAGHTFRPGSLKTQLMVIQVLRIREKGLAEHPLPRLAPPPPVAVERVPPAERTA